MIPALVATGVALILLYGAYESLTSTQVIKISSGSPGGGYYELGTKLEQVLNADLHEQRWEAPVVFQHVDSHGPQQNLRHLADRQAHWD